MNNLLREALSGLLQGIGWTIGMAVCGFAFVAFHLLIWLLIWATLILTLPLAIFLFWRNPRVVKHRWEQIRRLVSQRWEEIRRRIWDTVGEK
jgi:hypothetical protein